MSLSEFGGMVKLSKNICFAVLSLSVVVVCSLAIDDLGDLTTFLLRFLLSCEVCLRTYHATVHSCPRELHVEHGFDGFWPLKTMSKGKSQAFLPTRQGSQEWFCFRGRRKVEASPCFGTVRISCSCWIAELLSSLLGRETSLKGSGCEPWSIMSRAASASE